MRMSPDTNGNVTLFVEDTDRTAGNRAKNTVTVYYIAVVSRGTAGNVNLPPAVTITSPSSDIIVNEGDTIAFVGTAIDDNQGDISANLDWASDLDGHLATGGSFSTSTLSAGTHHITASSTDSLGATGSATVTVTVIGTPSGLTVTSVSPKTILLSDLLNGTVAVSINGGGFVPGASVSFANGSGPAPSASNVTVVSSALITLQLSGSNGGPKKPRQWDVIVSNSDGSSATCSGCLVIQP